MIKTNVGDTEFRINNSTNLADLFIHDIEYSSRYIYLYVSCGTVCVEQDLFKKAGRFLDLQGPCPSPRIIRD